MSSQKSLDDLVQTLNLEKLEENLYRGECEKLHGAESSVVKF